ncbi:unnamed protein product [Cuscuta europaea]|uniref:Endonuclease/exonuclease/phosphatase domain-containing protein n=1 Tax=Cuscuta europaea TaxID=41803 RepID=A0A9P0YX41_CUSEU|nr:unnamed protein product [Cuscuta europaea]
MGADRPWLVMGDFNDIMFASDKRGRIPHPPWLLRGFRETVWASGLRNFSFQGCQFTWERRRGTPNLVEEKLDKILVSESWLDVFGATVTESLEGAPSEHLALYIKLLPTQNFCRRRNFKFENVWLREADCREIVARSWGLGRNSDIMEQVFSCNKAVGEWGINKSGSYGRRINFCRKILIFLRQRWDTWGVNEFQRVKQEYLELLEKGNIFWRQRANEFWLQGGDLNTRYFHNAVKHRRRKNKMEGLKLEDGRWETDRSEVGNLIGDYFNTLFTASGGRGGGGGGAMYLDACNAV